MAETDSELAGLKARLERLERSNRRWRYGTIAGLAVVGLLGLFAAQRAAPAVPGVIRAHKFELVDSSGYVKATLGVDLGEAVFGLDGPKGSDSLALRPTGLEIGKLNGPGGPTASLSSVALYMRRGGGEIGIGASPQSWPLSPEPDIISIRDASGYETDIGATSLLTPASGETHQTSAASIVMFGSGKDHKVIWQVP